MLWPFCVSFSCNSMPCRGCSALHGVNPNLKKKMIACPHWLKDSSVTFMNHWKLFSKTSYPVIFYWAPGCALKVLWNRIHPIRPFGNFLGIGSLAFSETLYGVRGPCEVWVSEPDFLEKNFFLKNWENGPKIRFFEFIEKLGH